MTWVVVELMKETEPSARRKFAPEACQLPRPQLMDACWFAARWSYGPSIPLARLLIGVWASFQAFATQRQT